MIKRIAECIQVARKAAGLTQKQLALKSGVGFKTISSYETGERLHSMKVVHIVAIANARKVPVDFFFGPEKSATSLPPFTTCRCTHHRSRHVAGVSVCEVYGCRCLSFREREAA